MPGIWGLLRAPGFQPKMVWNGFSDEIDPAGTLSVPTNGVNVRAGLVGVPEPASDDAAVSGRRGRRV